MSYKAILQAASAARSQIDKASRDRQQANALALLDMVIDCRLALDGRRKANKHKEG